MKPTLKFRSLAFTGVITLLVCTLIGSIIFHFASQSLVNTVKEALTEIAVQGARIVEESIDKNLDILETIAVRDIITDENIGIDEKLNSLKAEVERNGYKRISIADVNGNSQTTDGIKIYVGDREYFKEAVSGKRYVSDVLISRVDGSMTIVFAVPVYRNRNVNSVIYATYDANVLSTITDNIRMGSKGNSYIIDSKGDTIAHDNRELVYSKDNTVANLENNPKLKSLAALEAQMIKGKTGAGEYYYNGVVKYMGYAPIKGTGWSIGVAAPKSAIFRNVNQIITFFLLATLLGVLAFAAMSFYMKYLINNLKKEQRTSNSAIEAASIVIIGFDLQGNILFFNKHAEIKTGYEIGEVVYSKKIFDIIPEKYIEEVKMLLKKLKMKPEPCSFEIPLKGKDGRVTYVLWNSVPQQYLRVEYVEIMGVDITQRVLSETKLKQSNEELTALYEEIAASEEELKQQFNELALNQEKLKKSEMEVRKLAYFDSLTGLPNRLQFLDKISKFINAGIAKAVVFFIDIDNFKLINDSFGHSIGDKLLVEIGKRICEIKKVNSIVSRLGGDEFTVLITDVEKKEDIKAYANKLMKALDMDFIVEGISLKISASIGIAIYPDDGGSYEELLKNADTAMYKAKEAGKRNYVFFHKAMNDGIIEKITMESNLRKAIDNGEFHLCYQAQVDLGSGKISGFESLIRWNSPNYGMISPLKFISLAEETGLIIPIGEWVLRKACGFCKQLHEMGFAETNISVNISIKQLIHDEFVDMVISILDETGLAPQYLELEITETVLMESIELNLMKLELLKNMGVRISLDDFGKGYSSLNYLKQLPINTLKIDKTFIDDIGSHKNITQSIIKIAHQMGLNVIAEGVETEEQFNFLKNNRCNTAQGYYISKPVSEHDTLKILEGEDPLPHIL